jgi:hypothetical protein
MHIAPKALSSSLMGLVLAVAMATPAPGIEILNVRSGNGIVGGPDASITFLGTGSCCSSEFPSFTAAHFSAAVTGPPAIIVGQAHPAWTEDLVCDPNAQWIGGQHVGPPETALYAQPFEVTTACIHSATIGFCWMTDDRLGGLTANLEGIYVNGNPIAGTSGGNFAADTSVGPIDVTALVNPGLNYIYFYNVDIGATVSGVNYSVRLVVEECPTPARSSTWSGIKSRY